MATCRICHNHENNEIITAREMMFGLRDTFDYLACADCGCVQIAQPPDDLSRYYPPEYYAFSPPRRGGRFAAWLQRQRAQHLLERSNLIGWLMVARYGVPPTIDYLRTAGVRPTQSVLEIGCGNGDRLLAMRSYGFRDLTGIDPYIDSDIDLGGGARVFKRELADYDGQHDFVMLHHAFEHMASPLEVLSHIRRLLVADGRMIIRTPVASSDAFATYGRDWIQLDPPRHLYVHTRKSIDILAEQAGLTVTRVVYDSTAFQFWGSEQYRRDIPLWGETSYQVNPTKSIFTDDEIADFERRAAQLNASERGDQCCFYLRLRG